MNGKSFWIAFGAIVFAIAVTAGIAYGGAYLYNWKQQKIQEQIDKNRPIAS